MLATLETSVKCENADAALAEALEHAQLCHKTSSGWVALGWLEAEPAE